MGFGLYIPYILWKNKSHVPVTTNQLVLLFQLLTIINHRLTS